MTSKRCTFKGCEKPYYSTGLCSGHKSQERKGKELTPLRRMTDATLRDSQGRKFCPGCDVWKNVTEFYPRLARKDGLNGDCKSCCVVKARASYVPNPRPERDPVCAYGPCDKPSINGPLCTGHHGQRRKGKELTPLRRKLNSTVRDDQGRKFCPTCDTWLPEASFHSSLKNSDRLSQMCSPCDSLYGMTRKFNISLDRYQKMLDSQGGGCAICGGQSRNGDRLSVDHDHACCPQRGRSCGQCVRGLLCADCNRSIGMMADDPQRLRAAADYLERG